METDNENISFTVEFFYLGSIGNTDTIIVERKIPRGEGKKRHGIQMTREKSEVEERSIHGSVVSSG